MINAWEKLGDQKFHSLKDLTTTPKKDGIKGDPKRVILFKKL